MACAEQLLFVLGSVDSLSAVASNIEELLSLKQALSTRFESRLLVLRKGSPPLAARLLQQSRALAQRHALAPPTELRRHATYSDLLIA